MAGNAFCVEWNKVIICWLFCREHNCTMRHDILCLCHIIGTIHFLSTFLERALYYCHFDIKTLYVKKLNLTPYYSQPTKFRDFDLKNLTVFAACWQYYRKTSISIFYINKWATEQFVVCWTVEPVLTVMQSLTLWLLKFAL